MSTSTVRIGPETRIVLKQLSERRGEPARVILRKALEDFRRKTFLEEANAAYAVLKADKKAWKAELEERKAWDVTLGDEGKAR